jgi:hypothetical protein
VKELRRLARATGLAEPVVRLWLEVSYEAELVAVVPDRSGGAALLPTAGYDRWVATEPAEQLAAVLPAWLDLPAAPLLGPAPGAGKPTPALVRDYHGQLAAAVRQLLLDLLASLPDGQAVADEAGLAEAMGWMSPMVLAPAAGADRLVAAVWREAYLAGVVAHGAYTALGAALAHGTDDELVAACASLLPAASNEAVFQADLTALVPGTPRRGLAELLDAAADRESGGGAVTWRFHAGSVRRALDAGWQAEQLLAALQQQAAGGRVPQPLAYLITDVARRHGAIRVRPAACVLRAEDPALVAELVAARSLRSLALAAVAPTVLTCAVPVERALAALREAGYAPVAEDSSGVPQLDRLPRQRAGDRRRRRESPPPADTELVELVEPLQLAKQLLAAPLPAAPARRRPAATGLPWSAAGYGGPAEQPDQPDLPPYPDLGHGLDPDEGHGQDPDEPRLPDGLPAARPPDVAAQLAEFAGHLTREQRRLLARAIERQQPVAISYTSLDGEQTVRVIDSIELERTHLVAWCQLREDERRFALRRIEAVAPPPPS